MTRTDERLSARLRSATRDETWRDDQVAGRFVSDALVRGHALEADLAWLLGADWRETLVPLPATRRYLAHHYTRYLGDLSGGQVIRHRLRSIYGLTEDGVRFFTFDGVGKPKLFKDRYRGLLDETPWGQPEQDDLVAEANQAFRLNRGVFDDLGEAHGVS